MPTYRFSGRVMTTYRFSGQVIDQTTHHRGIPNLRIEAWNAEPQATGLRLPIEPGPCP
jgi:hypothetical protein